MVRIKIRTTCITAQFGALSTGDILTCSEEFARHLVEDCKAADYITEPTPEPPAPKRGRKG